MSKVKITINDLSEGNVNIQSEPTLDELVKKHFSGKLTPAEEFAFILWQHAFHEMGYERMPWDEVEVVDEKPEQTEISKAVKHGIHKGETLQ